VTITGSAPSQSISFVLPQGPKGDVGPQGPAGPPINLGDETPQPLGTASAGTSLSAARADHVHATLASFPYGNLTGVPATFAPSAHSHVVADVTGLQAALDAKQVSGTYCPLVNNQVPSVHLPSFVDDVVDVGGTLPATGDVGKIYVVSTGANTNKIYRWSGSAFVEISPSPGSTDSVPEGSVNLYHTTARAAAAAPVQSVAGRTGVITLTKSDVGLGNVTDVDATARANHTGSQTAATISDFATEAAKYGPVVSVNGQTGAVVVSGGGGGGGVSEHASLVNFPSSGQSGVIYVAKDTDRLWRWDPFAGYVPVAAPSVFEQATAAAFPATGASHTLYIATDASRIYRWSGSVYVELGPQ
jgi:hypothetical protein